MSSPSLDSRFRRGGWYFVLVIATAGVFSAVPFLHAANRLHRPALRRTAAAFGLAGTAVFVLLTVVPRDAQGAPTDGVAQVLSNVAVLAAIATAVAACWQLRPVRRAVFPGDVPGPAVSAPGWEDPAVAAALWARTRRNEARERVRLDPLLARDLRIGRPDMARTYDDGGLLDLNVAPAEVIARLVEVPDWAAAAIVSAREHQGGSFNNIYEVLSLAALPADLHPAVLDRGVVIPR